MSIGKTANNPADLRCPICHGQVEQRLAVAGGCCGDWKCRRQFQLQRRRQRVETQKPREQQRQRNLKQATAMRNAMPSASGAPADAFITVLTPANSRRLVQQPRRRKYKFVKRLVKLVRKALQNRDAYTVAPKTKDERSADALLPIFGQACGNCGGKCCNRGGTHAFLDESAVLSVATRSDEEDEHAIIEAYCRYLPDQAYERSCVFHTETGCALPRTMRSATCNNTICASLSELQARVELDSETKFFLAAAKKDKIVRTRFVGDDPS